jgi:hypothetical protein
MPELCFSSPLFWRRGCREDRVPAGTHGPLCAKLRKKCTAGKTTGEAGNNPAFPAQWFDGLCRALPGDEFLLPPSLRELTMRSEPGWVDAAPRKLDCSNGSQDHTVLPYAAFAPPQRSRPRAREPSMCWQVELAAPFVLRAVKSSRARLNPLPALPVTSRAGAAAPTAIPHSTYRDDAYAPLHRGGMGQTKPAISGNEKQFISRARSGQGKSD